jgi:hypothetical protein
MPRCPTWSVVRPKADKGLGRQVQPDRQGATSSIASGSLVAYRETMKDVRLLKEDTITLVASYGAGRAEHAILIVDEADKHGKASVSLLHRYERGQ